jgi:hypothetical protein
LARALPQAVKLALPPDPVRAMRIPALSSQPRAPPTLV